MKLFLNYFDNNLNKPSNKFFLNLFFLNNIFYFNFKNILHIHLFINLSKYLNIKIFKFNYTVYKNFILYFILLNVFIQLFLIIVVFI